MHIHIIEATEILTLVAAISVDALIAALSYGAENIRIPFKSTLIIHIISIGCIWISVVFGQYVSQYIPSNITKIISAIILFALGLTKLFDGIIKNALRKTENYKKDIHFSLKSLKFILSVYADPKSADADRSKTLSPKEAAVLAVTLSADSFPIGIGLGICSYPVICIIFLAVAADEFALRLGQFLGMKTAANPHIDISWIGGALLIAMSIFKLI
ncbi:MAG: sporulation membrane protein YtaF [Clostridia bacterium]|nr:sporulation membrane protein YtaF [Clostridia bacterium]